MAAPIVIGGIDLRPGERATVEFPLPNLYTHSEMKMTVKVIHGKRSGPTVFICGALHGDELNGVEIIRRVLPRIDESQLKGTVIAVPIVNVFGFINQSRYLPDRRDLNRSFPGSSNGSLAARLAHTFMRDIVRRCDYGIDLHTAAANRVNLPQIRGDLKDEVTRAGAIAFGAPAAIHANARDGSLRQAATEVGCRVWLYEGGETLRFDEETIEVGIRGILRLLKHLGMRKSAPRRMVAQTPTFATTAWVRARQSGVLHLSVNLGDEVAKNTTLATVADPYGEHVTTVRAPQRGIVIGHAVTPLVHRGDAVVHIAVPEGAR